MNGSKRTATSAANSWWRGGVIYQIYPRSYQDTNGDGVGDLDGVTRRLPHIASLGVDAIWLSPFFRSPMKDFGYDVSDYCDIDPMFGDLAAFDRMLARAHELGLKVMIDQVLSHASDQHLWFVESRKNRTNAKADWFVWADAGPGGAAPNNWLSVFGGAAWTWDPTREQYYLHNFLDSQPDLNLHNVEVQDALLSTVKFWLDRGVDGFRLDTINFYFHDQQLRDNPILDRDRVNDAIAPSVNPYNLQDHLYDKNRPENLEFLKRFRSLLDRYDDRAAVGEVGDAQYGLKIVGEYTSGDDKVQMCYSFELLSPEPPTPARLRAASEEFLREAPEGWVCWALSNHDVQRHASRFAGDLDDVERDAYLAALLAALLSLRGTICLYQGEELGLPEAEIAFEDIQDPYGRSFWPEFKGRDGCRTPMPWRSDAQLAGFSDHDRPWLPIPEAHRLRAVDRQEADERSLLAAYRRLLAFRNAHRALFAAGDVRFLDAPDGVLLLERTLEDERMVAAVNLTGRATTLKAPAAVAPSSGHGFTDAAIEGDSLHLGAFQAFFGFGSTSSAEEGGAP